MNEERSFWRKCASCKKEIPFNGIYQVCNVSTCRKNIYCSVDCWDLHNPVMNHKSSWAEENRAPKKDEFLKAPEGRRVRMVSSPSKTVSSGDAPQDILIVASKLKNYIKLKHDFNTSGNVMEILSHIVRSVCDDAIENAQNEGRRTLMDRDFKNH